jgi:hypothetical protein
MCVQEVSTSCQTQIEQVTCARVKMYIYIYYANVRSYVFMRLRRVITSFYTRVQQVTCARIKMYIYIYIHTSCKCR